MLAACSSPDPAEQGVAEALERISDAVEAKDSKAVMGEIDEDFTLRRTGREDLNHFLAGRTLRHLLDRYRDITVVTSGLDVTQDPLRDDLAHVRFNVLVTGGQGRLLPERGELYRIDSQWRHDGQWRLLQATARRALE
ncbi:MAG: hypothetical protein ACPG43_04330 [Alcanivoracaceae bacterium]